MEEPISLSDTDSGLNALKTVLSPKYFIILKALREEDLWTGLNLMGLVAFISLVINIVL